MSESESPVLISQNVDADQYNVVIYCRVSTDKEDQLNSLEAQKEFFSEYTKRTGDNLVRLYADEGISGTKIKNRKEFLRMMADAEHGLFDMVVVKDISRFARNTRRSRRRKNSASSTMPPKFRTTTMEVGDSPASISFRFQIPMMPQRAAPARMLAQAPAGLFLCSAV